MASTRVEALHVIVMIVLVKRAWAQEDHDSLPKSAGHHHYHPRADVGQDLRDDKFTMDIKHIREDLEHYFNTTNLEFSKMSREEVQFYYFSLHDFDKNGMMDGLELLRAVLHVVEHDDDPSEQVYRSTDVNAYAVAIDQIYGEDDLNKDGYLSYEEFMYAQSSYSV